MAKSIPRRVLQEAADPATEPARLLELVQRYFTEKQGPSGTLGLRRALAQNANCPKELLARLAHTKDKKTKEHLTQNPSTPLASLEVLVPQFPRAFLQNPLLPLLCLEDPALGQLSEGMRVALFAGIETHEELSPLSAAFCANELLRVCIAESEQLSPFMCALLLKSSDHRVRVCIARNAATPVALILELIKEPYEDIARGILQNQKVTEEVLLGLAKSKHISLHPEVAEHPKSTPLVLSALAETVGYYTKRSVAKNPMTPIEALRKLAQSDDHITRLYIANHPKTPKEALLLLREDPHPDVREAARGRVS